MINHDCIFAVHSMQINFRRPAKFNDALMIKSIILNVSGASFEFKQIFFRGNELLCEAVVKVACLEANRFRPKSIPSFILMEIESER